MKLITPTAFPPPPRKWLGQHFLIDPNIIKKIVHLSGLQPDETVVEIGPGRGILTTALCQKVEKVLAIETDKKLVDYLTQALVHHSNLEVIHGDALKFPYATLPRGTVIVANLPYNVSTPLLFRFLDARCRIKHMVLTLQLEVARRLVAAAGTRDYGVLSVMIQFFAEARLAFQVPKTCFRPSPKVDSAVVRIDLRDGTAVGDPEAKMFGRVVRAAFSHRRKTLLNSMRDGGFPVREISAAFNQVEIDGQRRAETLTVQEFENLTHAISKVRGSD